MMQRDRVRGLRGDINPTAAILGRSQQALRDIGLSYRETRRIAVRPVGFAPGGRRLQRAPNGCRFPPADLQPSTNPQRECGTIREAYDQGPYGFEEARKRDSRWTSLRNVVAGCPELSDEGV